MASPRPTPCVPRSQGMSPSRGSDPDSRDRRSRRRGHGPTVRASAAAGFRSGRIRGRLARRPTVQLPPPLPARRCPIPCVAATPPVQRSQHRAETFRRSRRADRQWSARFRSRLGPLPPRRSIPRSGYPPSSRRPDAAAVLGRRVPGAAPPVPRRVQQRWRGGSTPGLEQCAQVRGRHRRRALRQSAQLRRFPAPRRRRPAAPRSKCPWRMPR